ncbi:MAG: hypothetical protein KatS3mg119_1878 [Rhodothalassiaceae bacterium]|nr:MAG: hypothetical protein KatS3mg119_1878 [Rhodothalassiaceae bacterium]
MSRCEGRCGRQHLWLRPHPLVPDAGVVPVPAGLTIMEMLQHAAAGAGISDALIVEVDGRAVPREAWTRLRPGPESVIRVTGRPSGRTGKKILRTVLMIAVIAAANAYGSTLANFLGVAGRFGTLLIQGALVTLGALAINALIPPPPPKPDEPARGFHQLTGSRNQLLPYGPIPQVLGEMRFFPAHAAIPYTETLGDEQYQHVLLDLGHGDLVVSDLKIGDTPIAQYEDVEWEVTTSPTLYRDDVAEVQIGAALNADGDEVIRTTSPDVDEISLDLLFPRGLFGLTNKGKRKRPAVTLAIDYRPAGGTGWTAAPAPGTVTAGVTARASSIAYAGGQWRVTGQDQRPFAAAVSWGVTRGQYDVRVRRIATDWDGSDSPNQIGDLAWSVLRGIRKGNPSTTGTTKLALRIRASDQLEGVLDTVSCRVQQQVPVYDPATQTWTTRASRNPAWLAWWLLTQAPSVSIHVPAARMDLDAFAAFAAWCDQQGLGASLVLDQRRPLREVVDEVLGAGLGALAIRDGRYTVIWDDGQQLTAQLFTPLEMRGFRLSRPFPRRPHALRVRFVNAAADWQVDEILVPDDGHAVAGLDARGNPTSDPEATEFETLELKAVTDPIQAWQVARFHLAQARFRHTVYEWETDVAALTCLRGDKVRVAHDVTEWGDAWGRITGISGQQVSIDETLALDPQTSYSVRIRPGDGGPEWTAAVSAIVDEHTLTLAAAPPAGVGPGDILVVGETTRDVMDLLITAVEPIEDLGARIRAVEYRPEVAQYWADPPAAVTSQITGRRFSPPPCAPQITVVISDQQHDDGTDQGDTSPSVHVHVPPPAGHTPPVGGVRWFGREQLR